MRSKTAVLLTAICVTAFPMRTIDRLPVVFQPEGVEFIRARQDPALRIASLEAGASCVPLEPSPAFRLEFDSRAGRPRAEDQQLPGIKVFSVNRRAFR